MFTFIFLKIPPYLSTTKAEYVSEEAGALSKKILNFEEINLSTTTLSPRLSASIISFYIITVQRFHF